MIVLVVLFTVLVTLELQALAMTDAADLGALTHPQVDVVTLAGHEILRLRSDGLIGSLAHQDARGGGEDDPRGQADEHA